MRAPIGAAHGPGPCPPYLLLTRAGRSIQANLELGRWTADGIQSLLTQVQSCFDDPAGRLVQVARRLRRTPFVFESQLSIPERDQVRVRLASLDCVTFVYTALALARAKSVEDFIWNLCSIRYLNWQRFGLDSDPATGNIFDFVYESLYENATALGLLADVTAEVAGRRGVTTVSGQLAPFRRHPAFDSAELTVTPKLGTRTVCAPMLLQANFDRLASPQLRSGDVVLLGKSKARGQEVPGLVNHLVIADDQEGRVHFLHCTRNFAWRPSASTSSVGEHAGIFIGGDARREQLGVEFGGEHAGDDVAVYVDGLSYHGYIQERRRELADYAKNNFDHALILRSQ
ncbi:N-acetylmuramoyl-L-alanine amidase-like domain-containing protein [Sinorhizobium meliloti]|uniref:N-acetylmuramoyl-L-alanine amidase-like domain-containing protein n=1 Tax=Rhizobium meliloti TaxID=382 RepID=UPI000FDB841B|nr:N-acetylmuramoyl-L-alanine amidase-like domain-containing protein [Sinorhizobium meliloti]RVQ56049.1 DUF1460 domain-containing protein [Sinorhizobium meliloti]